MLEVKTSLDKEDYQKLLFDSYMSKNLGKIKNKYFEEKRLSSYENRSKLIILKIKNKKYLGEIKALPLIPDYSPIDYKCKKWKLDIKTFFKIFIDININDEETIIDIADVEYLLIDNKKYYLGDYKKENNMINFEFIAYDSLQKENYIII